MEAADGALPKKWSRRKRDKAPRGVSRRPDGMWRIRYTCGIGCWPPHKETVGPLKSEAIRLYHERRNRARSEPGWCPRIEEERERARARAEQARERARITFRTYADQYLEWAQKHHRSYTTTKGQVEALVRAFGEKKLDEITTADVEHFLARLDVAPATVNRYRDRLSGMFKRALRLGLVAANSVTGVPKLREPGGRVVYLPSATNERPAIEEDAIRKALPPELQPLFTVSVHTGLRWSEQVGLSWGHVDLHTDVITVPRSKHGETRHVPINSIVRSVFFDLSLRRQRPDDRTEAVFPCRYTQADKFFPKVVQRAQEALRAAGKDASALDGYTWHGNRHTFASRLVMAGVDPRTVQELGGWKTLKMVQRYAHLAPGHLHDAVERLVTSGVAEVARK